MTRRLPALLGLVSAAAAQLMLTWCGASVGRKDVEKRVADIAALRDGAKPDNVIRPEI